MYPDEGGWANVFEEVSQFMSRLLVSLFASVAVAVLVILPAGARTSTTVVKVTAGKPTEFHFILSRSTVPVGSVTFKITNHGLLTHNFTIDGKHSKNMTPGSSATLTVVFKKAGRYPYKCSVPGHADAGMKGVLVVKK